MFKNPAPLQDTILWWSKDIIRIQNTDQYCPENQQTNLKTEISEDNISNRDYGFFLQNFHIFFIQNFENE